MSAGERVKNRGCPCGWPEEIEREKILETIMGYVNGLRPGQGLKIVAHDPAKEKDHRRFTVTKLYSE